MMKRDGMLIALVQQALWKRASTDQVAQRLLASIAGSAEVKDLRLTREDVDHICSALLNELTATGLDEESEPTTRGLQLEAAIDFVRRNFLAGTRKS